MRQSDPPPRPSGLFQRARSFLVILAIVGAAALVASPSASATESYTVTIVVPAESPLTGDPFTITGTVTPAAAGTQVQLERYYGGAFHAVAVDKLDASSSYSFTQVFDTVGGRTFRVTKHAAHGIGAGVSPIRRVFITGSSVQSAVLLKSGNGLISADGTYSLTLLASGDLVMTLNSTGRVIWSFGTAGHPGATAVLQRDGNFVVHDADGQVVKTTGTGGRAAGVYSLTLREDSDLWISAPDGKFVWSNMTTNPWLRKFETLHAGQFLRSSDQDYKLIMQPNGDLVLRDLADGSARWHTKTAVPNSQVTMGPGGALNVYGPTGKLVWSSHTLGHPGAYTYLRPDGVLVLYQKGVVIWASEELGGVLGDDYPAYLRKADKDSIIDPWRFYNRECTSFVAWRMNSANHVDFQNFMGGGRFGNAYNWDDNARQLGYLVDDVPARGAIAQSDAEGHVAWVASVGDGVVTIEDYNYTDPGEYDVRTVPTSKYIYIHIKDL